MTSTKSLDDSSLGKISAKGEVSITHEQNIIYSKIHLDGTTHEQTIICRQLFSGHVLCSRLKKGKEKHARNICELVMLFFFFF